MPLPVAYERALYSRVLMSQCILEAHTNALGCIIELQNLVHCSTGLAKYLLLTQRGSNTGKHCLSLISTNISTSALDSLCNLLYCASVCALSEWREAQREACHYEFTLVLYTK